MALRYTSPKKRRKAAVALRPVHPNVGIEVEYRRRLKKLIDAMQKSVAYHIERSYRGNEPEMAQDDRLPADNLQRAVWKMSEQWLQNFDDAAEKLAKWFAKAVHKRSDTVLKKILKDGGFSVEFQMTPAMKDVFAASVHENVSLIKSIPQQYLKNVEGDVMRSVAAGRDLATLTKSLQKNYGVTARRAAFIARDQNNKVNGAMQRARQKELGITKAKWRHSGGGKHPRPTHVANDGKLYDVNKGWFDPHVKRWIIPGELPNCRCVSIPVITGFD